MRRSPSQSLSPAKRRCQHRTLPADPKEQLKALKDARANGYKIIGNFHSHPESPSRPSEEDKRLAFDPTIEYLILSLMEEGNPVLKAFEIDKEKNVTIHEIEITE